MRVSFNIERVTRGEIAGAWRVSAWRGSQYLGECAYLFHTKKSALATARQTVKEEGGLGIYRKSFA
jgi:hypothetical protein